MGLFSGIKKVFKKIKKVFKKIVKGIGKVFGKNFMKIVGVALSVFTGGASLAAAFAANGVGGLIQAGVSNLISSAVNMIKMPIDLIGKGISAVGNVTGATSLSDFGANLVKSSSEFGTKVIGAAENALGINSSTISPGGPATGNALDASGKAKTGAGGVDLAGPAEAGAQAGADAAAGADVGIEAAADLATNNPVPGADVGIEAAADLATNSPATTAGADTSNSFIGKTKSLLKSGKGMLSKAAKFTDDHPTLAKFGLDAAAGFFSEDEETTEDMYKARARYEAGLGLSEEGLAQLQESGSFDMSGRNPNAQKQRGMISTAAAYGSARTGQVAPIHKGQRYQYGAPPVKQLKQA